MKNKPTTDLSRVFGAVCISVGIILFLVTLHIMVINESGYTESVLLTTFTIALRISIAMASIAFVFILIYFIRMLIYVSTTPEWYRKERDDEDG